MATTEELLAQLENNPEMYASDESQELVIDAETRTINIPASETLFGVKGDKNIERKYFRCPRIVGDNIDLSTHLIYIAYVYTESNSGSIFPSIGIQPYHCDDVAVDGDDIMFSWKLSDHVFQSAGFIAFKMYAKEKEDSPYTVFNTAPALGTVLYTIDDGVESVVSEYPDIINQLLAEMENVQEIATPEAMQNYVEVYLAEHPVEPTDEQASEGIDKWLDEHPEATTTVQDGSLDEKKIQVSFRNKIKRTYRTFQDVLKDTSLEINTFIETSGFYNVDDGGDGLYLVSSYVPSDGNPCYFSHLGKYIVYIAKENVCNALALGIKKDGSADCSDIVNKFFASTDGVSKRSYSLYFPAGVYLFTKPIKIENSIVYANILGCASSRGTYTYVYNDNFYPQHSATVFVFDIPESTTAMTVNIKNNGSFNINGIIFASKSCLFKSEGFETRPTVPYNVFSIEKKVENVNGLNIEKCYKSSVENCSFIGFSGYGLRSYSHNILNCYFSDCSVAVENNKSDLMLFNCYITKCENGIKAGSEGVIWVSNTFIDQCVMHGILSENVPQTTLVLNGCIIDHIGYSGICVEGALDANIDARMGRCGMYYAGKTTGFSDMVEDEKKKATTIYFGRLSRGNFRLNIYKRSITDDSTNLDYVLPNVVFGGAYTNVVVTGLHYKDYLLFCNEENVHNTMIYADDGIHTYS